MGPMSRLPKYRVSLPYCSQKFGGQGTLRLTNMQGPCLYSLVTLIRQNNVMSLGVQRRPPRKENAILEQRLRAPPPLLPLLVEQHGRSHGSPLRVANDGVERAVLLDHVEQVLDGTVRRAMRRGDGRGRAVLRLGRRRRVVTLTAEQFPHRAFGRLALGEIPDPGEHILILPLAGGPIGLDEAVVGRRSKVILEAWWRCCFAGPLDEVEGRHTAIADICELF